MVWVDCDPCPLALLIEATLAYVRYVASAAATVGSGRSRPGTAAVASHIELIARVELPYRRRL